MRVVSNAVGVGTEELPPAGFISLMHDRNYALLWWGQLISELGNRFHWVAVSLWFYSLTHSATKVALAIASMHVGGLLVGLWAGVLVDRLDRKRILIVSDLARVLLVALIPTLMKMNMWLVYFDLAVISMATAFFRPTIFAVIPQIVNRRNLLPANSFFSAMDTGTEIVGPALAGVLAAAYGYASLLYLDAASYGVSAICVSGMLIPQGIATFAGKLNIRSVLGGVTEGLRYIRRDRLQWALFVLIFPAYMASSGLNALLAPLAKGVVGITDAQFGTFNSVWGVGFVLASFLLTWSGAGIRKSLIILIGYFTMFTATALMGLSTSFQALLATGFMVGFANTFYYVGLITVVMEKTPQNVMGRVISTRQFALRAVNLFSPLLFGVLADSIGIRQAILAMAMVSAAGTGITVVAYPILWNFDRVLRRGDRLFDIRNFFTGPTTPVYDNQQQRRLNFVSVCLVLSGLVAILYQIPRQALWILLVLLSIGMLGSLARRKGFISKIDNR